MPNIQNFKTALADGGARPNQFKVTLSFPVGQASANEQLLVSGAALPASTVNPVITQYRGCLLYTSPSPRDQRQSRMPSSA